MDMTVLDDAMLDSIEDAQRLVAWCQPNSVAAVYDSRVERLALAALSTRVSPEVGFATPMLFFANPDLEPQPLLQAVLFPPRHRPTHCDLCGVAADKTHLGHIPHELWVPMGSSVVVFYLCDYTARHLENRSYTGQPTTWTNLVWS